MLLNTDFAGPELAEVSARESVDLLVHDLEYADILVGIAPRLGRSLAFTGVVRAALDVPTLDELAASPPTSPPPNPGGHAQLVLLTSGTTGTPKGAPREEPTSLAQRTRGGRRVSGPASGPNSVESGRSAHGRHPSWRTSVARMRKEKIADRTVVVTGGARGIGAAIAAEMHRRGARVAIADIDGVQAAATAERLGAGVIGRQVDVTDRAAFAAFLDDVEATLGAVDVLVNNAGIMVVDRFTEEDPERADLQIALNLNAVVHGTREGARRMVERRSGHIVNVASAAGRIGFVGVATYSATKFGVYGLCEALRRELRGTGVDISCVMPGLVNTELAAGVGSHPLLPTVQPEHLARKVAHAVESRRFAVFAPGVMPLFVLSAAVLPHALMDALLRLIGGDRLMIRAAHSPARRAYDSRSGAVVVPDPLGVDEQQKV